MGINVRDVAEQLLDRSPDMDPAGISGKRLAALMSKLPAPGATSYPALSTQDANAVVARWKALYEEACYDELFEGMADGGELTDGELPSHSQYNIREAGYAENSDV